MNYMDWLNFVQALASVYAVSQGKDVRALAYLRVASNLLTGQQTTNVELQALKDEYYAKVAGMIPTSEAELLELDARLSARSAAIQAA